MDVLVLDDAKAACRHVVGLVLGSVERDPALVLGVATGGTPLPVYRELARAGADFSRVRLVALDEYVGLPAGHSGSFAAYVGREIAGPLRIPPANVVLPRGRGAGLESRLAELGGVDLQLLGIGRNGHLAFNEPGSALDSRTRVVALSATTRRDNAEPFGAEPVPTHAVTQGIGTILEARHLVLLATGEAKAAAVAAALTGPVTSECPASVLNRHPHVTVVLDAAAAGCLSLPGPWRAPRPCPAPSRPR